MKGVIRATPAELRQVAGGIQGEHEEISAEINALHQELSAFTQFFQGAAANAFQHALGEWKKAAGGIALQVEALADYLDTSANTIEGVDSQLAQAVAGGAGGAAITPVGSGVVPRREVIGTQPVRPIDPRPPRPPVIDPREEAIRDHLAELEQRYHQLERRLDLVEHRIGWEQEHIQGLEHRQQALSDIRADLAAAGASPEELAVIDEQMAEHQTSIDSAQESLTRLEERQTELQGRLDEIRDDYGDLAESIGEPGLPGDPEVGIPDVISDPGTDELRYLRPLPMPDWISIDTPQIEFISTPQEELRPRVMEQPS